MPADSSALASAEATSRVLTKHLLSICILTSMGDPETSRLPSLQSNTFANVATFPAVARAKVKYAPSLVSRSRCAALVFRFCWPFCQTLRDARDTSANGQPV